jgi:biopolymer transport protein ExbB
MSRESKRFRPCKLASGLWVLASLMLVCAGAVFAAPEKNVKTHELEALKASVAAARDSLQNEIADRWRQKQRSVEQREADKEELDRQRDGQEQAFAELSRVKEECLAAQRSIEDEAKEAARKQEEWQFVAVTLTDFLTKDADAVLEQFPLDREERRGDLEVLRRNFRTDKDPTKALAAFLAYQRAYLRRGMHCSLERRTVLPDQGDPQLLTIARFGSVFGYGSSEKGALYFIRQTGLLGAQRYSIVPLGESSLQTALPQSFARWARAQAIQGPVITDIMHNDQSLLLISGKKVSTFSRFAKWFRDGGPVMIPLFLVALWALVIFFAKLVQFGAKGRNNRGLYECMLPLLSAHDMDKARQTVANRKGFSSRVALACLHNVSLGRESAEKAVRALVTQEVPVLNKHINTLAVLATAAPLLGLLGTVTGMINLFAVLTQYGNSDPKLVAGGISEALVTTQTGMIIAIPIVLMHNYLRNKKDGIQAEAEKLAIGMLNQLWP